MKPRTLRTLALLALTLTPAVIALPQSLADTAKKEQARRKKVAKTAPKKVYTESDLPASPAAGEPSEVDNKGDGANQITSPPRNEDANAATKEAADREAAAALKAQAAEIKERIAEGEVVVKRLANHPTGGGKVCRIPEGVFQPGVTAAEQVVCPYEMESRYERAKRELGQAKGELAALASEAKRLRVVL